MVEAALALPVVVLSFLALFQVTYLAAGRWTAEQAAHAGARAAAVGAESGEVLMASNGVTLAVLGLPALAGLDEEFGHVSVEVRILVPFLVPGLSRFFGHRLGIPVRGECTMIREPES